MELVMGIGSIMDTISNNDSNFLLLAVIKDDCNEED